jgi:hypothetical protein
VGGAAIFFRDALEWVFAEAEDEDASPSLVLGGEDTAKEVSDDGAVSLSH